jgi:alpha-tubulin suppressor-like RCC1 family protein
MQIGVYTGPTTSPVLTVAQAGISSLGVGSFHSCSVVSDGTAVCWGLDDAGQLGWGGNMSFAPVNPVVLNSAKNTKLAGVLSLAPGSHHTCAQTSLGNYCWGNPQGGAFGDGGGGASLTGAEAKSALDGWTSFSAGNQNTCGLYSGGLPICSGPNDVGQAGVGAALDLGKPLVVSGIGSATQIATGDQTVCAITGGDVVCWGRNDKGQVGDGTQTDRPLPVPVKW